MAFVSHFFKLPNLKNGGNFRRKMVRHPCPPLDKLQRLKASFSTKK
jgi:hypothetical protein